MKSSPPVNMFVNRRISANAATKFTKLFYFLGWGKNLAHVISEAFFVGVGFPYNCSWGWAMGMFSSIWHVLVSKNKPRTSQTRQINNNNKISIPMTTQQKIYPKIAENILPALGPGGPILFGITFRRLYLYLHLHLHLYLPIALWCDFFSK